jgi:hypothetical protein
VGGPPVIQLPKTALFLREFVIDLPDIHALQGRRSRAGTVLADVYKQVPLVLRRPNMGEECRAGCFPTPALTT